MEFVWFMSAFLTSASLSSALVFFIPFFIFIRNKFQDHFKLSLSVLPFIWLGFLINIGLIVSHLNREFFDFELDSAKSPVSAGLFLGIMLPILLFGFDQKRWKNRS